MLISEAIEKAARTGFAADEGIFEFLRDALDHGPDQAGRASAQCAAGAPLRMKVQAVYRPHDGESLEDTAFYRYHRLLALNEVGGDPSAKALDRRLSRGHEGSRQEWPHGMKATATHDTKRGEDARARLMALAAAAWELASAVAAVENPECTDLVIAGEMPRALRGVRIYAVPGPVGAWPSGGRDACVSGADAGLCTKAAREANRKPAGSIPTRLMRRDCRRLSNAFWIARVGRIPDSRNAWRSVSRGWVPLNSLSQISR